MWAVFLFLFEEREKWIEGLARWRKINYYLIIIIINNNNSPKVHLHLHVVGDGKRCGIISGWDKHIAGCTSSRLMQLWRTHKNGEIQNLFKKMVATRRSSGLSWCRRVGKQHASRRWRAMWWTHVQSMFPAISRSWHFDFWFLTLKGQEPSFHSIPLRNFYWLALHFYTSTKIAINTIFWPFDPVSPDN